MDWVLHWWCASDKYSRATQLSIAWFACVLGRWTAEV